MKTDCSFIIAMNDRRVFENTFRRSPALERFGEGEVLIKEGYPSAAKAYNDAIEEANSDLLIFVHQDIFLPETWPADLSKALDFLERNDENWGVLGCYGTTREKIGWGHLYSTGLRGVIGAPLGEPRQVQTLDEIVLIMRKSSGLRFDVNLLHFHFYGTDICLSAERAGKRNYAFDGFCIHNSNQVTRFPREFFECYRYIKNKYRELLPIQTSCIRITKYDGEYLRYKGVQRLRQLQRGGRGNVRSDNVMNLWNELSPRRGG
jgi:hypothetical protein